MKKVKQHFLFQRQSIDFYSITGRRYPLVQRFWTFIFFIIYSIAICIWYWTTLVTGNSRIIWAFIFFIIYTIFIPESGTGQPWYFARPATVGPCHCIIYTIFISIRHRAALIFCHSSLIWTFVFIIE